MVVPIFRAGFSRVTHPFATLPYDPKVESVRLACVKRAASVRPEPGSNSSVYIFPLTRVFAEVHLLNR